MSISLKFSRFHLIIILFLAGFIIRLILSSYSLSDLFWDMGEYHKIALEMINGKWSVDCCLRNVGYSLFLSPIYIIFGTNNIPAIRLTQIIMDLAIALIIYKVAMRHFGIKAAIFSYSLYIFNPLTSVYTGLRLSEILSFFIIALIILVTSSSRINKSGLIWLLMGILFGLLVFTKVMFFYFVLTTMVIMLILSVKSKRIFYFIAVLTGFLLASAYSLIGNWLNFQIVSFSPPYNIGPGIFYLSFYENEYPIFDISKLDKSYAEKLNGYINTPLKEKPKISHKYFNLFLIKLYKEWPLFISIVFRNIFLIWDKNYLYPYYDPFYPSDSLPLQIYNLFVLGLFFIGLGVFTLKQGLKSIHDPLIIFTFLLLVYITFFVALTSNESRYSLTFYPLIFLFGGYGVSKSLDKLICLRRNKS